MAPHQTSERWHAICALAAEEQDAEQLQILTREINRLLEDKERRLKRELPRHWEVRLQNAPGLG
jgi:hypothetical protein